MLGSALAQAAGGKCCHLLGLQQSCTNSCLHPECVLMSGWHHDESHCQESAAWASCGLCRDMLGCIAMSLQLRQVSSVWSMPCDLAAHAGVPSYCSWASCVSWTLQMQPLSACGRQASGISQTL